MVVFHVNAEPSFQNYTFVKYLIFYMEEGVETVWEGSKVTECWIQHCGSNPHTKIKTQSRPRT